MPMLQLLQLFAEVVLGLHETFQVIETGALLISLATHSLHLVLQVPESSDDA